MWALKAASSSMYFASCQDNPLPSPASNELSVSPAKVAYLFQLPSRHIVLNQWYMTVSSLTMLMLSIIMKLPHLKTSGNGRPDYILVKGTKSS